MTPPGPPDAARLKMGEFAYPRDHVLVWLTAAGVALGTLLLVLVIVQI